MIKLSQPPSTERAADPFGPRVTEAQARFEAAASVATCSVPYGIVGLVWGPAALVSLVFAFMGWRRGRSGVAAYTLLIESVVDVYGRDLGRRSPCLCLKAA